MSKPITIFFSVSFVVLVGCVVWMVRAMTPSIVETTLDAGIITDAGVSAESKEPPIPVSDPATEGCAMVPLKSPGEFVAVCTKRICAADKPAVNIANTYSAWDNAIAEFALKTPAGVACAQGSCPSAQWAPDGKMCPLLVLTGTLRMLPPRQPASPELVPVTPTPKKTPPKR